MNKLSSGVINPFNPTTEGSNGSILGIPVHTERGDFSAAFRG